MQCISLNWLRRYLVEGAFTPRKSEGIPKLSGTTAILLVFQVDSRHEQITDVFIGLVAHQYESCLYPPEQISNFIGDIEVNLREAQKVLKDGGNPGKSHAFCLFMHNLRVLCPSSQTHHTAWCTPSVM